MSAGQTLPELLTAWRDQGWLQPLNVAFARFLSSLGTDQPIADEVLLLAALLSHLESRGHTCLPLDALAGGAADLLAWPPPGEAAWRQARARWPASRWQAALRVSPVVDTEPHAGGQQPLVLDGGRLYLRRYWRLEQAVARQIQARVARRLPVDEDTAAQALAALFGPPRGGFDWQRMACAIALRAGLSVITGGPGTGKTYTVARLLAVLQALAPDGRPWRITLAAPTGKAAARLRQSIEQNVADTRVAWPPDLMRDIGPASTLHALLGVQPGTRRFRHHAGQPLDVDVLIVDEASMVHLEMMAALLDALPPGARLILLGDKDQLASVEAGAVLGDLCRDAARGGYDEDTAAYVQRLTSLVLPEGFRRGAPASPPVQRPRGPAAGDARPVQGDLFATPEALEASARPAAPSSPLASQTVMLRESRRFQGPIGALARAVNEGDAAQALALLSGQAAGGEASAARAWLPGAPHTVVNLAVHGRAGAEGSLGAYLAEMRQRPDETAGEPAWQAWAHRVLAAFDRCRVLCAVREGDWGVDSLNRAIEDELVRADLLRRTAEWHEGRPVMVTRNDPSLGVFNGDVGVALRWPGRAGEPLLKVFFKDGPHLRSVLASRLPEVDTAYAMTVHKSQGSEFEHTVLALPEDPRGHLHRELVYTGITRARQALSLVAAQPSVLAAAIGRPTLRHSGLAQALGPLVTLES